jgi:hypothetical protein
VGGRAGLPQAWLLAMAEHSALLRVALEVTLGDDRAVVTRESVWTD